MRWSSNSGPGLRCRRLRPDKKSRPYPRVLPTALHHDTSCDNQRGASPPPHAPKRMAWQFTPPVIFRSFPRSPRLLSLSFHAVGENTPTLLPSLPLLRMTTTNPIDDTTTLPTPAVPVPPRARTQGQETNRATTYCRAVAAC